MDHDKCVIGSNRCSCKFYDDNDNEINENHADISLDDGKLVTFTKVISKNHQTLLDDVAS